MWPTNFDKDTKNTLQYMVLGKLDIHMQKNENGPLSYTTHKHLLEMY